MEAAAARVLVVSMVAFVAKIASPTCIRTLHELMDQLHDRVTSALHAAVFEEVGYNVSVVHEVVTTFGEVVAALQLEFRSFFSPDHPENFDALRPVFLSGQAPRTRLMKVCSIAIVPHGYLRTRL